MTPLTKEERDILIGSLLGDGCLRTMGRRAVNPAFSVSHGEQQKKYVFWKYEKLKRLVLTAPWKEERVYHKDRNRMLGSWRFQTISNAIFSDLFRLFYRDGEKVIPDSIAALIRKAPLSLAVWFMDDGNRNYNAVFLNTQSFELVDQYKLAQALSDAYEFDVTVNKHSVWSGRQLYRIRISTESTKKLAEVIRPYILPEFYYKIPNFSP